jgi:thiaminase
MQIDPLLTMEVTTTVLAPPGVLRQRLDSMLADRKNRESRYSAWAKTVSGKWLIRDIQKLEKELSISGNGLKCK